MAKKGKRKAKGKGKGGSSGGQYLSPGVYLEEIESGARPIEGVGTSIAAFVGFPEDIPEVPRKRHRGRKVVVVVILAAGAALAVRGWRQAQP
jgi:phage tail sheath protein FI